MPVPPPIPDPLHTETRLLIWAEALDRAVAEVTRVLAEIKGEVAPRDEQPPDDAAQEPT